MAMMACRLRRAVALARAFSTIPSLSSNGFLQKSISSTIYSGYRPLRGFIEPSPLLGCLIVRFRVSNSGSVYSPLDSGNSGQRSTLFEGTDYNHWLVTMEWPDPQPSREEKIDAFVKTLANVVGSEEEAKKRIYALSTTTYTGFMCEISEELSEKIKNEPGVVWVLPDSYADPINKTYGVGDKYINGVIIPDTKTYNNRSSGRYNDRPRNRRRDSMPVERRDLQTSRESLPQAVSVDTMQSGSMQGDVQDYRQAVDGRGPMMGDTQDYRAAMNGKDLMSGDRRGPMRDERRDNRSPSMDGRVQDYGLPPRDGRVQDYGIPPRGVGGPDYGTPMGARGPDYGTPMDRRGTDYGTPMGARGPDYGTPMDGRSPNYGTPLGARGTDYRMAVDGRGPDYRPPMDRRGPDYRTPMDRRGPDYRIPMDRSGQDYRTPMGGKSPDYGTPMEGRGTNYRSPMDGRGPDYRTPIDRSGPMPFGDQHYRPTMDDRGPMPVANQQGYRSPMSGRGPMASGEQPNDRSPMENRGPMTSGDGQYYSEAVTGRGAMQAEHQDHMPSKEPIQGQQRDTLGNQGRETLHEGERESFPWPMERTN